MIVGEAEVELRPDVDAGRWRRDTAAQIGPPTRDTGRRAGRDFGDEFVRSADGRLRDSRGRFVAEGRESGRRFARGFGDGFNLDVQRVKLTGFAQRIRDIRTIYSATLGPIQAFTRQIAATAVGAGAAATAIGGGIGLAGATLSAVGSIGALVGLLPVAATALVGFQAATLVARIGVLGVADAIGDVLSEDLAKLSPRAQSFVDEIERMAPALVKAKNAIQDNLFEGLTRYVEPLVKTYLPALTRRGREVAVTFNGVVQTAVQEALRPATVRLFDRALGSLSGAVRNVGAGLRGFVPVVAGIAATAAPIVERVAKQLGSAMQGVRRDLEGALKSGAVEEFISGGIQAAEDLLGILGNVVGIFFQIQQAAKEAFGDSVLGVVRQFLSTVRAGLTSGGGRDALVEAFTALQPVLAGVGDVLRLLMPQLASLVPVIAELGVAFTDALKPVIPVLGGLARAVGGALADVLPAVSTLAVALGNALTSAIETLAPIIPPLAAAISDLLAPTGALDSLLQALAPILPPIAAALGAVVTAVGGALAKAFTDLASSGAIDMLGESFVILATALAGIAPTLIQAIADAFIQLAPYLPQIATDLATAATVLVEELAPYLPGIATALGDLAGVVALLASGLPLLAGALGSIPALLDGVARGAKAAADAVGASVPAMIVNFASMPGSAARALAPLVGRVIAIGGQVVDALQTYASRAVSVAVGVLATAPGRAAAAIGGLVGQVARAVNNLPGRLLELATQSVVKLTGALRTAPGKAAAALSGMPAAVVRALAGIAGRAFAAGAGIVQALADGIRSKLPSVANAAAAIAGAAGRFWPGSPVKEGPLRVLNDGYAGGQIAKMIADGMLGSTDDVRRAADELARQALVGGPGPMAAAAAGAGRAGGSAGRLDPADLRALIAAASGDRGDVYLGRDKVGEVVSRAVGDRVMVDERTNV